MTTVAATLIVLLFVAYVLLIATRCNYRFTVGRARYICSKHRWHKDSHNMVEVGE